MTSPPIRSAQHGDMRGEKSLRVWIMEYLEKYPTIDALARHRGSSKGTAMSKFGPMSQGALPRIRCARE